MLLLKKLGHWVKFSKSDCNRPNTSRKKKKKRKEGEEKEDEEETATRKESILTMFSNS